MARVTRKKPPAKAPTGHVVEAVGVATGKRSDLADRMEAAMAAAAQEAMNKGEGDPAKIRAAMLAARERVRDGK